jgi:nitrogen fixation NifU-like protein
MSDLGDLYQEIILDHNNSHRNFRVMEDATHRVEAYNPLCGDHYTIYVKMEGNVIADVSFDGSGCAISKASASVMTSVLKGKTKEEADRVFERFHDLVTRSEPVTEEELDALGKVGAFVGVRDYPMRVKCATLAWHTLHAALEGGATAVSTE